MAEKGGQPGNNNATKSKPWALAIARALAKRSQSLGAQRDALDDLAEKLLTQCDQGDMTALKELGDRLDGRSAQSVNLGDPDGNPLFSRIERAIIDTQNRNG